MPIILQESDRHFGHTSLWSVQESAEFFKAALEPTALDMDHLDQWHPRRQLEWLSGRYLVHQFMDIDLVDLQVEPHGKPCFANSDVHISISHTKGLVGLQYHQKPIGLDLQINTDKIHRVASKFCTDNDYNLLGRLFDKERIEHITWGYKEAVYKAFGKGQVSYKDHIVLEHVEAKGAIPRLHIRLIQDGFSLSYSGRIRKFGPYHMVQVVQKS